MDRSPALMETLAVIYRWHAQWTSALSFACRRGCSACCTCSVTMSEIEGAFLLAGLEEPSRLWLIRRLLRAGQRSRPRLTTNGWAAACLRGGEALDEEPPVLDPCPFLEDDQSCGIYPVRPFGCRCFASMVDCSVNGAAAQPDLLLEINTATMQIIEHLSQGLLWGNMLDLLGVLLARRHADLLPSTALCGASDALQPARALPGFLIMPEERQAVEAYLTQLMEERVGKQSVGRILGLAHGATSAPFSGGWFSR